MHLETPSTFAHCFPCAILTCALREKIGSDNHTTLVVRTVRACPRIPFAARPPATRCSPARARALCPVCVRWCVALRARRPSGAAAGCAPPASASSALSTCSSAFSTSSPTRRSAADLRAEALPLSRPRAHVVRGGKAQPACSCARHRTHGRARRPARAKVPTQAARAHARACARARTCALPCVHPRFHPARTCWHAHHHAHLLIRAHGQQVHVLTHTRAHAERSSH
eukprot:6174442-Pleurochrysis_carterae.AAC.1